MIKIKIIDPLKVNAAPPFSFLHKCLMERSSQQDDDRTLAELQSILRSAACGNPNFGGGWSRSPIPGEEDDPEFETHEKRWLKGIDCDCVFGDWILIGNL